MSERRLRDLLVSVRSKNAGPFVVTFDLFFGDEERYEEVVSSGVISPESVAPLFGLQPADVKVHPFKPAFAIKVAVPRLVPGGAPGDTDVAGGQQFVPLLDLAL